MTVMLRKEKKVQSTKKREKAATNCEQLQRNAFLFPARRSCVCQHLSTSLPVPETM